MSKYFIKIDFISNIYWRQEGTYGYWVVVLGWEEGMSNAATLISKAL
jgi:hypothetical protein